MDEPIWHITAVDENCWGRCGVCGEKIFGDDVMEVVKPDGKHILAHVGCAQANNLPMA